MESPRTLNRPRTGYWLVRLRRNGPEIPAAIVSITHEPGNAENILSTGPVFVANIGFTEVDPLYVWHRKGRPISQEDYNLAMAQLAWDRNWDSAAASLRPFDPVDLTAIPPLGPEER